MTTLFLVGTVHQVQASSPSEPLFALAEEFHAWLLAQSTFHGVQGIAEELSADSLRDCRLECSAGMRVADAMGIPHRMCDPGFSEREKLGVVSKTQLAVGAFWNDATADQYDELLRQHNYDIREQFWLDQLTQFDCDLSLFVCGADHIRSFGAKLEGIGIEVVVLVENWGAGRY